jgi:hypothetical protein
MKNLTDKSVTVVARQRVKIFGKGLYDFGEDFIFNSCASYALEYNDCPIASYNRAVNLGHATHWANATAACISSDGPKYVDPEITLNIGDVVYFEGRHFEIEPANNNNVHLKEVKI